MGEGWLWMSVRLMFLKILLPVIVGAGVFCAAWWLGFQEGAKPEPPVHRVTVKLERVDSGMMIGQIFDVPSLVPGAAEAKRFVDEKVFPLAVVEGRRLREVELFAEISSGNPVEKTLTFGKRKVRAELSSEIKRHTLLRLVDGSLPDRFDVHYYQSHFDDPWVLAEGLSYDQAVARMRRGLFEDFDLAASFHAEARKRGKSIDQLIQDGFDSGSGG